MRHPSLDPARGARGRGLLLALTLALAALWIAQYQPFDFPNNDFYSFRRAARSLAAGALPASLKRGPILPGIMALLRPALPDGHPELHAALLANLAFSLGMFLALGRFALRTFPAAAPLFLVLLATTPVLHAMALQPLVEPSLGCFVALAFLGLRARSPWQYAAAGAAALSRPEAAALLAILAAANGLAEGRWLRHLGLAALAGVPFVAWNALGGARGSGAATYLALHEGFASWAPHYLSMLPKELLSGFWGRGPLSLGLLAAAAATAAFGALRALRAAPREAGAMLAWLAISVTAVVLYGVGKARYLHPIAFVPLLCFAVGAGDAAARAAATLTARLSPGARSLLLWVAAADGAALAARAALPLLARDTALPPGPDLAFAALALALLGAACAVLPSPRAGRATGLVAFAVCAPLVVGGVARKSELLADVHDFDVAAWAASQWVAKDLPPDGRVVLLHRSQVLFATGLPSDRVISFSRFEAKDLEALRREMAERGVTHVIYTWRRPPRTDAERFYARRRREDLAALFASGDALPGFEHVATLPAPRRLHQPPAEVYRLEPPDG
jgi:hypothetical protein